MPTCADVCQSPAYYTTIEPAALTKGRSYPSDETLREWFLAHGADPNVPNSMGYNYLDWAASNMPISVLKTLVEKHGGKPERSSALQSAAQSVSRPDEALEKMAYLLDHGARINSRDQEWCAKIRNVGCSFRNTGTPLHFAVAYEYEEMVEFLLQRGADPTVTDWRGRSPVETRKWARGPKSERITVMLKDALVVQKLKEPRLS